MRLFPHGRIRSAVFIAFVPVVFLIPAWIWVGIWGGTQLLLTVRALADDAIAGGGVAYAAHAGGIIAGLLLAGLFKNDAVYEEQKATRAANKDFENKGPIQFPLLHMMRK